jgi:hypothetical protein
MRTLAAAHRIKAKPIMSGTVGRSPSRLLLLDRTVMQRDKRLHVMAREISVDGQARGHVLVLLPEQAREAA